MTYQLGLLHCTHLLMTLGGVSDDHKKKPLKKFDRKKI